MPEISRFFGIIISMHHKDHPPPHFHTRYGASKRCLRYGHHGFWREICRPEYWVSSQNGQHCIGMN